MAAIITIVVAESIVVALEASLSLTPCKGAAWLIPKMGTVADMFPKNITFIVPL